MRRSVLLILMVVTAACGRDSADVRFAEGPAGESVPGPVVSALPTPSESASAEPVPPTPASAASTPPTAAEPVAPGPATAQPEPTPTRSPDGPRELGQDEKAEIGRPYRYRLYTHCGIDTTWFDGRWWNAEPPQSDGNGNPPPNWDNPYQDGVIVLVSPDRLEFTADSGRRAGFVPRPQEQGAPPPCA